MVHILTALSNKSQRVTECVTLLVHVVVLLIDSLALVQFSLHRSNPVTRGRRHGKGQQRRGGAKFECTVLVNVVKGRPKNYINILKIRVIGLCVKKIF